MEKQKDLQCCYVHIFSVLLLPSSAFQHWVNDLPSLAFKCTAVQNGERVNAKSENTPSQTLPLLFRNLKFTLT